MVSKVKEHEKSEALKQSHEYLLNKFRQVNKPTVKIYYQVFKTSCDINGNFSKHVRFYLSVDNDITDISCHIKNIFDLKFTKDLYLKIHNSDIVFYERALRTWYIENHEININFIEV